MWRKALQISKKNLRLPICIIFFIFIISSQISAQSMEMLQMPEMPAMPTMPTMQSISSGSFYTPTVPTAPVSPAKQNSAKTNNTEDKSNEAVLSNANTTTNTTNSLQTDPSNILTASDILGLYDSGLFSDLSSLDTTSSVQNYATTSQTNLLLQQMLNSLNDLKTQQNNADAYQKTEMEVKQSDAQNFKSREPKILRFKINGYDILSSLSAYFISEQEADGTFLLTADRKYYVDQFPRTETFYMLFRPTSTTGSCLTYNVQPTLTQDYKNENSFIYRMTQTGNLTAEKTGNLVVLHYSDKNLSVDLLLDLDNK